MGITNLGAVSMSAGGVYNPETVYKRYKVVSANGGSYMYINPTPAAGVPVTDTSHWQQIAQKGDTGASSYQAAVAGGFTGTEAEFNTAMADMPGATEAANEAAGLVNDNLSNFALMQKADGNPITVYPAPESALGYRVKLQSIQAGSGNPSPSNVRVISPGLSISDDVTISIQEGNSVDVSNMTAQDWHGIPEALTEVGNGEVVIRTGVKILTGEEFYRTPGLQPEGTYAHGISVSGMLLSNYGPGICSHYRNDRTGKASNTARFSEGSTSNIYLYNDLTTAQAMKDYATQQFNAGTPITFVYKLAAPSVIAVTTPILMARKQDNSYTPVANTISADKGVLEVVYAKSLPKEHDENSRGIKALEFNPSNYAEKLTGSAESGIKEVRFFGSTVGMDKDNAVPMTYKLWDGRAGGVGVKWQGSSSLSYPKKNYSITFAENQTIVAGWGAQKKYCLKANFIDFSHARNNVCAKLWSDIILSRDSVPAWVANAPHAGAIDGFPIMLFINDEYVGLYSFNIPKDKWMFGMTGTGTEAVLSAEATGEITHFRALAQVDGSDFKIEHSAGLTQSVIKDSINAAISISTIPGNNGIWNTIDLGTSIDYMIFVALLTGFDLTGHNYLLVTFDGVKWYQSAYDLDSVFGNYWAGHSYVSINHHPTILNAVNQIGIKIRYEKIPELKARYAALRSGVMSEDAVYERFYNYMATIPRALRDRECIIWPQIPGTDTNTIDQIMTNYRMRTKFIDGQVNGL